VYRYTMDATKHIKQLLRAEHGDPSGFLGLHTGDNHVFVRSYLPEAKEAWVIREPADMAKQTETGKGKVENRKPAIYPMQKIHKEGFFEAVIDGKKGFRYKFKIINHNGEDKELYDPYSFEPVLTDFDLHLLSEGTHYRNYEKLGSHVMTIDGIKGVHFAVWAPNARNVSIAGDFNNWDGRRYPMRNLGASGIWELFIPGLDEGAVYKYEV
jgi:1,4-alpha-glucan branching enzyme